MKKILFAFFSFVLILSVSGCSKGTEASKQNEITNKLYIYNNPGDVFDFDFLWFNTDDTFQGLKVAGVDNFVSHYGTYEVKDNAVTLNYTGDSYAGVIREDGNRVYFGDAEFLDWTEHTKPDDPIYDKITK